MAGPFPYGEEPEQPPFPLTKEIAATLLGKNFRLLNDVPGTQNVPIYQARTLAEMGRRRGLNVTSRMENCWLPSERRLAESRR